MTPSPAPFLIASTALLLADVLRLAPADHAVMFLLNPDHALTLQVLPDGSRWAGPTRDLGHVKQLHGLLRELRSDADQDITAACQQRRLSAAPDVQELAGSLLLRTAAATRAEEAALLVADRYGHGRLTCRLEDGRVRRCADGEAVHRQLAAAHDLAVARAGIRRGPKPPLELVPAVRYSAA